MSGESLEALQAELEKTRAELSEARARIAMMEMSFFWKLRNAWWRLKGWLTGAASSGASAAAPAADPGLVHLPGFEPVFFRGPAFDRTTAAVDVVVLAHDDLPVLRECLGALLRHARPPYTLSLADPGAPPAVAAFLEDFAREQGAALHAGDGAFEKALGAGSSRHVLLLDGRARIAPDVLDRLIACLASDAWAAAAVPIAADVPGAGPAVESAAQSLVEADSEAKPATLFAAESARLFPSLESGGGCAVLVKRSALPAGAERSPQELVAVLRAAGRPVLLADDAWVAGAEPASGGASDRVSAGIGARLAILPERIALRTGARRRFEGKRVLYVLPVLERGGGSNVVLSEARAMARMGVEARVFNLAGHRTVFEKSYPAPGVPIVYGRESELAAAAEGFDAVIGTAHYSIPWMVPLAKLPRPPVLGYCIQDYEPLFYPEGSDDWKRAFATYGLVPGMRRFSKSKWNADEVVARTGLDCALVSASFDAEVFRPRRPEPAETPVRIAAMVRPSTPRRQPGLTVDVMRALAQKLGAGVEIVLFGSERTDPALRSFRLDFPHRFLGVLDDRQLSALLSQVHVFADLSTYQALGVASLEAMASGAAVVVPKAGGADTFARDGINALAVDTSSREACAASLERLATDAQLLRRLSAQAIADAGFHTPDRAAAGILEVLFAKRRVHVLHGFYGAEIPYSCTYIRLLCPLSHPALGADVELTHGTAEAIPDCDLLIVERHTLWPYERQLDGFVRVLAKCRRAGIPVVYELDDNLLDLRRDEPWEPYPGDHLRGVVSFLARGADGVIVSTPTLAERVGKLRKGVLVVPNALDERLFGSAPGPSAPRSTVTIGYMGTLTHDADLRMVLAPLRALLRRHAGRVRLEIVGGGAGQGMASLFEGLPFRMRSPGHEDAYPKFVPWMRQHLRWDAAIAPLEDDAFTRGKSDLKYLDYGALGIPGVFSDVGPYRGTVRHGVTGLLAANEPAAWAEALELIVGDAALRARLAAAATAEVHGTRTLRTNAPLWKAAIETIVPGFFG